MPNQSFNSGGYRLTHRYRIRSMVLGSVLEEQQEHSDGSVRWRRAQFPVPFTRVHPDGYVPALHLWATGQCRVRNGWFGLVVEELMHTPGDAGDQRWRKIATPMHLNVPTDRSEQRE